MNALFFWLFSGGMIVCALAVILNRNAVASALCFTFAIVFMAGLFVMLSAFFLAAVQILVTAGAVMVLFLFIIMLLDLSAMEQIPRQKVWMGCTLVLALGFLLIVAKVLAATPEGLVTVDSLKTPGIAERIVIKPQVSAEGKTLDVDLDQTISQGELDQQDDTHWIGRLLFRTNTSNGQTSYVAPFEITSLLILVATIGVIVLCKQDERPRPGSREEITREAPPIEPEKETTLKT
jgi:NADH:ubiquinone oxidoreductase subunit 6 (subunit J)